jgi:N-methylhydantoinase B
MDGGGRGTPGHLWQIGTDGSRRVLSSKAAQVEMKAGESIRLETPGGGGYGLPSERDPARLAADISGGKYTEATARAAYGDALVDRALAVGDR